MARTGTLLPHLSRTMLGRPTLRATILATTETLTRAFFRSQTPAPDIQGYGEDSAAAPTTSLSATVHLLKLLNWTKRDYCSIVDIFGRYGVVEDVKIEQRALGRKPRFHRFDCYDKMSSGAAAAHVVRDLKAGFLDNEDICEDMQVMPKDDNVDNVATDRMAPAGNGSSSWEHKSNSALFGTVNW
jgi:hypothetical protein